MISVDPAARLVTMPDDDTEATLGFDDDHEHCVVTFCVVPVDRVAVAVNWAVWWIDGVVPATETEVMDATLAMTR